MRANYGSQSTAVENVVNGEMSPEMFDVIRFKLYIRHVRTRLYGFLASANFGDISDITKPW